MRVDEATLACPRKTRASSARWSALSAFMHSRLPPCPSLLPPKCLLTAGPILQGHKDERAAALRADEVVWILGEIIYAARGAELEVTFTHFYLTRPIWQISHTRLIAAGTRSTCCSWWFSAAMNLNRFLLCLPKLLLLSKRRYNHCDCLNFKKMSYVSTYRIYLLTYLPMVLINGESRSQHNFRNW